MAASMGGAFHTGADFEAGRVHAVHQEERLDGGEPTDAREDEHDERAFRPAADRAPRPQYKWALPEGLKVAEKPATLDASLVNAKISMRWEAPHGWLIGVISEKFTQATPRLFAKFNYRIKWFDGWQNHKISSWTTTSRAPRLPTTAGCCWRRCARASRALERRCACMRSGRCERERCGLLPAGSEITAEM